MTAPIDDIFARYADFCGKPREMMMLCALLHQKGLYADAVAIGAAAVAEAPLDMAIRAEVSFTLSSGVAKFHYPMPFGERSAFSRGAPFFPFTTPIATRAGDIITAPLRHRDTRLMIDGVKL